MPHEVNPFQELYVTDTPDLKSFVQLFSDYPAQHAHALFRPGNVVMKGTQGSGKSMLLNLLRPDIRLAYHDASVRFPVPEELVGYVGAGINLAKSGALDIGTRPIKDDPEREEAMFPMYFSDFLNFFIVSDLLASLVTMRDHPDAFNRLVQGDQLNSFAVRLSKEDCWFGAIQDVGCFADLQRALSARVTSYREFHNNYGLAWPIDTTPTTIGEPIARTAQCLKEEGVIPEASPVFIRIDQLERLYRSDLIRPVLCKQYRRVINKALGTRDLRVSYRIGTRRYGWDEDLFIFGTGEQLEHLRDYRFIDLDYAVRRQENRQTWYFPDFVEDVFARRLLHAGYIDGGDSYWRDGPRKRDLIGRILGRTIDPREAAKRYRKTGAASKVLGIDNAWPEEWRRFLTELSQGDPMEAALAAAWARQRGAATEGRRLNRPPPVDERPWNKKYWRKERSRQCLMQIAARSAQRLEWAGKEHIQALSAGNISVFLSICHEVWESFLRSERSQHSDGLRSPLEQPIAPSVQAAGIYTASSFWYEKISELPKGDDRRAFLDALARTFRSWLLDDAAMSYPGHNGFSLALEDIRACPAIRRFLQDAAAYGDLHDRPHTTKRKDRRQRSKWYLNPILSPYYQLPESHVKEPYYATLSDVSWWVQDAGIAIEGMGQIPPSKPMRGRRAKRWRRNDGEQPLFNG